MMKIPFTDDEIIELSKRQRPTAIWAKAFDFYNSDTKNVRVSMGCAPCYAKVIEYILKIRLTE